jgi:SurA N-terminal domain/PPIC-type PPIASE domain
MLDAIRKRQRTLLTIITIVVIVAFAWFYNPASMRRGEGPGGAIGKLNGRTITVGDIQKIERSMQLVFSLGMQGLVEDLTTEGRTRDDQSLSFAWNLLLLRDEAKRLQIVPSADQIRNTEKALPQFQTDNHFDPAKYQQFVDAALKPNGFTAADLDDVVADNLRYAGVSQLVEGSTPLPESMFKQQYEVLNQIMSLAVLRFNRSDFESSVQVTDAEVQKYYDQHRDTILSPEKRKVALVSFLLTDDQKKLADEQKIAAKKPLADAADTFAQAALQNPATFESAKEKGFTVIETEPFTMEQPDKALSQVPALPRAAFTLTKDNPISDVTEGTDGFYVMKLTDIVASRPLALAEAKDQIVAAIKEEKAEAAIQAKAKEVSAKIVAEMQQGIGFVQAAENADYKVETPEPFALINPGKSEDLARFIAMNAVELNPGETSKLLQDQGSALIIHMIKKEPIDEQKYAEFKKTTYAQQNSQYEKVALREWLRVELQKAGRPPFFGHGATG